MRILCLFQRCGTNHRIYRGFRLQRFAEGEHWECAACGRQASVTAGTVMHGLKLPLFWAVYLMATHSNALPPLQLHASLGLGLYKSAWLAISLRRKDHPPAGSSCSCLGYYSARGDWPCRVTVTADPDLRRVRLDLLIRSAECNLRSVPANADAHQTVRGRHSRGVEQVPAGTGGPVQERLENRMEIRRVQAPRVRADVAGRNAQGTAERDAQVSEVSAYTDALRHRIKGRGQQVGRTEDIIDVVANPVADTVDAMIAGRQIAELLP